MTIAKLVYNHHRVKQHFKLRMWVCLSDVFDVKDTVKAIIVSATEVCDLPTVELLHGRLRGHQTEEEILIQSWMADGYIASEEKCKCECYKEVEGHASRNGEIKLPANLNKVYIVGNYSESGKGELKELKLSGQLELYNLKDVRKAEDAKVVNLNFKRNLHTLALCWGMIELIDVGSLYENVEVRVEDAEAVLKELKPPNGIKRLTIWGYSGVNLPTWMLESFLPQHFVEIHLGGCRKCQHLPPFREDSFKDLDSLGEPRIGGCEELALSLDPSLTVPSPSPVSTSSASTLSSSSSGVALPPQLEDLSFDTCDGLKELPRCPASLRRLNIRNCPNFMSLTEEMGHPSYFA
ncbi:disease resistance [Musa troglodytarum]|uniref:Disease resistance n=1 Tax=Musa troglodytarum TaxID=320322 RepID=A0A9E7FYA5_9LILI|nr:disease resistance [Musa troglodytarum]